MRDSFVSSSHEDGTMLVQWSYHTIGITNSQTLFLFIYLFYLFFFFINIYHPPPLLQPIYRVSLLLEFSMFTTALKSTGLGWGSTTGITFLCRTKLVRCPHQSQNIDLNVVLFLVWSHTRPYWSPIFPISFFCATIVLAFFYKIFQFFAIFDHFCTFFS